MTMIGNCREKFKKDAYPYGDRVPQDEINPYWEGNLKGENRENIQGYDWAIGDIDRFFECNIDEVMSEYLGAYAAGQIDMAVMNDQRTIDEFSEEEIAKMSKETYLLKAIHSELNIFMEDTRDEIITGLLDEQDDE